MEQLLKSSSSKFLTCVMQTTLEIFGLLLMKFIFCMSIWALLVSVSNTRIIVVSIVSEFNLLALILS